MKTVIVQNPDTLPRRVIAEWVLRSGQLYDNSFTGVKVTGEFIAPSGAVITVPGFYDGDNTWRVRFSPGEIGKWQVRITACPTNTGLEHSGVFMVTPADVRGFLCVTPGQAWGATDAEKGWLATGITEKITASLAGWPGAAILSEYGYERNPDVPITFPGFEHTDAEHNRRGGWRGAFAGVGIANGFENTWGPFMILDQDQVGVQYLMNIRKFFTEVLPFQELEPAPDVIVPRDVPSGCAPLALASPARDRCAEYLPAGGPVTLSLNQALAGDARWYDPRTGLQQSAAPVDIADGGLTFTAPATGDEPDHPWDWVLAIG